MTVSVTGGSEQQVFSFSKSIFLKLVGLIFGGFGLSMLIGLAGVGIMTAV